MQCEEARFVKRKIRAGQIDVHPIESALVVHYELEAYILGELGERMLGEKKKCQKVIRLKSLNQDTDCGALAKEVIQKCGLIHSSKLADVEHLIYYLQTRKNNLFSERVESPLHGSIHSGTESPLSSENIGSLSSEKASMLNIESYVELLYENLAEKIKGSGLILDLAKDPNNLQELSKNESLLSALSRVLYEDWKKSMELSTNIVYVFFCFSTFTQFHRIIVQNKLGSLCMEIIEFELRRYDQWKAELESCRRQCDSHQSSESNKEKASLPRSADSRKSFGHSHIPVSRKGTDLSSAPEEEKKKKRNSLLLPGEITRRHIASATERSKRNSLVSSPSVEDKEMTKGNHSPSPTNFTRSMTESSANEDKFSVKDGGKRQREEFEKTAKKFRTLIQNQDQLLRVCFYLLLNVAEDDRVEDKMRKKNIVRMLIKTLERTTPELLLLTVTFLKKLSLHEANKNEMANLSIMDKLQRVLQVHNPELEHVTLKLLFNLSFDSRLQERMVRVGYLPKLVNMLADKHHQPTVLKILYHLSMDDRVKSMFTFTDCVSLVMDMILYDNEEEQFDIVLIALAINLALNKRNAFMMVEGNRLQLLMGQAFRNTNSLLMKIVRNISQHDVCKPLFVEFVGDLAKVLKECNDKDFVLECLGVMANLTIPDLDYLKVFQQFHLIPWLKTHLVSGKAEDDFILEVVMLVGTASADENCASLLCEAEILLLLIELLKAKQEDDEMVLQIVYVFYQMARHNHTRNYLICETEAPAYLIDLMHDKNPEIRKLCDVCLDVIKECNKEWAIRIKLEKFRWHNSQWLEMVESQALDPSGYGQFGDEAEPLPAFLSSDLLTQSMLFPAGSHVSLDDMDDIEILSNSALSRNGSRPESRDGNLDGYSMQEKKNSEDPSVNAYNYLMLSTDID